jgi:hypothetical protein
LVHPHHLGQFGDGELVLIVVAHKAGIGATECLDEQRRGGRFGHRNTRQVGRWSEILS